MRAAWIAQPMSLLTLSGCCEARFDLASRQIIHHVFPLKLSEVEGSHPLPFLEMGVRPLDKRSPFQASQDC